MRILLGVGALALVVLVACGAYVVGAQEDDGGDTVVVIEPTTTTVCSDWDAYVAPC